MRSNESMPAKRFRRDYNGEKIYIIITYDDEGSPYAVQESSSGEIINYDQNQLAMRDALFRMTTLALRYCPEKGKVIRDLKNCGRGEKTLPSIIGDLIG